LIATRTGTALTPVDVPSLSARQALATAAKLSKPSATKGLQHPRAVFDGRNSRLSRECFTRSERRDYIVCGRSLKEPCERINLPARLGLIWQHSLKEIAPGRFTGPLSRFRSQDDGRKPLADGLNFVVQ
jgi:hypothetical protein